MEKYAFKKSQIDKNIKFKVHLTSSKLMLKRCFCVFYKLHDYLQKPFRFTL